MSIRKFYAKELDAEIEIAVKDAQRPLLQIISEKDAIINSLKDDLARSKVGSFDVSHNPNSDSLNVRFVVSREVLSGVRGSEGIQRFCESIAKDLYYRITSALAPNSSQYFRGPVHLWDTNVFPTSPWEGPVP